MLKSVFQNILEDLKGDLVNRIVGELRTTVVTGLTCSRVRSLNTLSLQILIKGSSLDIIEDNFADKTTDRP